MLGFDDADSVASLATHPVWHVNVANVGQLLWAAAPAKNFTSRSRIRLGWACHGARRPT
jgi:hypothetical protein